MPSQRVSLEGDYSIARAQELHQALLTSFKPSSEVVVEASGVTAADASCLQLLASAARTADESGTAFRIVEPSEPLLAAFRRAGLVISTKTGRVPHA